MAREAPRAGKGLPGYGIWIVLAVAALLRIVYLIDYQAHSVFWDSMMLDAEIYDQWAQRIAAGDWMGGEEVFTLPPLYPYLLALVFGLFGHGYAAVYAVQSLMGLASIWLIHDIGRKVFGGWTPLIAAAMAAAYGSLMFLESKLMSTTLAVLLGLCLMRLLLAAGERQTLALWAACGTLLGVAALGRPETLLFAPLACWWIHTVTRSRGGPARKPAPLDQYALAGRQPWFAISVFAAFAVIAVSPVTLRNWVASGDWSLSNLISSQAGITFYQSNNARAGGLYVALGREGFSGDPHAQPREEKTIAEKETGRSLKRSEVTRYWLGRGLRWIAAEPARFLILECKKLLRFLGSNEYSTEYIIYVERETVRSLWLTPLPFAAISGLAVAGLLLQAARGFKPPALLLLLFVAANLLAVLIFYVSSRYRMPSAPYLILFAASGVKRIVEGLTSSAASIRMEARIYAIVAMVLAGVFHVQVDESHRIQEANVHYNAGNQHYNRKQYERALAEYQRALAGDPSNWRASYNMGNTLDALGRKQEAITSFREVLERNEKMEGARRRILELGGTP